MAKILVTGSNGEVGQSLIPSLKSRGLEIISIDISEPKDNIKKNSEFVKGDITDKNFLEKIINESDISACFHLAAILSTSGEADPEKAHNINVNGAINLMSLIFKKAQKEKKKIRFIFPSSIAAFGMPNIETKRACIKVKETEFTNPITMYGINKLYVELLGNYYSNFYKLLEGTDISLFDFRCVRFPGLISSETIPTGGTSDYGPEMVHFASQNKPYECFVRPDSVIPFMAMPDAIKALLTLFDAPEQSLTQIVYNVTGFSATAEEIAKKVISHFPDAQIKFKVNPPRQRIIDSWPVDTDDSKAKKDWNWQPDYDFDRTFDEYLIKR